MHADPGLVATLVIRLEAAQVDLQHGVGAHFARGRRDDPDLPRILERVDDERLNH